MTMQATTRWRLAFARRCLLRARVALDDASPFGPSEAVMAAQDGIEMALWASAYERQVAPSQYIPKFAQLLDAVMGSDHPHWRRSFEELNDLRVHAKHKGAAVGADEAMRRIEAAEDAIRAFTLAFSPHVDVLQVFLAAALQNRLVGDRLAETERLLDDAVQSDAFVVALTHAAFHAKEQAADGLRVVTSQKFPARGLRRARKLDRDVTHAIEQLEEATLESLRALADQIAQQSLFGDRRSALLVNQYLPDWQRGHNAHRWRSSDSLPVATRRQLFLIVLGMAERAEEIENASPDDSFAAQAIAAAEGYTVRGERRLVGCLRPGGRYRVISWKAESDESVIVRLHGVDAEVPRSALRGEG